MMPGMRFRIVVATLLLAAVPAAAPAGSDPWARPEYRQIVSRLAVGWNTWDSRSVTSQVLLPEGFTISLAFKQVRWLQEGYLARALVGRRDTGAEQVKPGLHALGGSYSDLELRWEEVDARVETATEGGDLVILVTPLARPSSPVHLVVQSGMLWNRPGALAREEGALVARLPGGRTVRVSCTGPPVDDPYVPAMAPYLVVDLVGPVAISTGPARSVDEARALVGRSRQALQAQAAKAFGERAETALAMQAAVGWNTVYEPRYDRIVTTVGRLWNEDYGGYALFGWDNFFLAWLCSPFSGDLAFANVIEHLRSATAEGFIPNDDRGNGSKSYDRSQPPVGALMVREVYRRYPERWLLEAAFDPLLAWNRWWMKRRLNDGLLSYGSHRAENPFNEPEVGTRTTAGYESGMDDSPMYAGVPFDSGAGIFALQDVGLSSLYIADCRALAEIAGLLGREQERGELAARADAMAAKLESLWDEHTGLYLNRRADTGELSPRVSPTAFYPLLARVPKPERAARMVREHLVADGEFGGDPMLPSVARSDPAFPRQRYWQGAVWPPLNALVYLGLRNYAEPEARQRLAASSEALLLGEWRRMGFVCENYSAISATCDDYRLSSDPLHTWGALLGMVALVEAGKAPAPEDPLPRTAP
jgi:putative isomerase